MNKSVKTEKIISFGLFFIFLAVVFLMIPVTYAINDDTAMRDIASGAMSGTPDYHLVFVKAALGMMLKALYSFISGIDWYGCLWIGFVLFSTILIFWKILSICSRKGKNQIAVTVLFIIGFILTALWHLVSFQFTVVSGIVIGAAIFYYYVDDSRGIKSGFSAALVVIMIWISFCVRSDAFIMAVPFGGLIFLYKKESIKKKIIMALIAIAGIAGIIGIETISYVGEDWQSYCTYNTARSTIYDYYGVPPYEGNKEFYDQIGLRDYDVVNLERYHLALVDGLEEGKMQQIAEYAEQKYMEETSFPMRLKKGVKLALNGEVNGENIVLNLVAKLVILLNLIWGVKHNKKSFWVNIGLLLCEGGVCLYLGLAGRLPERVMAALLLIELMSALGIFMKEFENGACEYWGNVSRKFMGTAFVLILALAVWRFIDIRNGQEQKFRSNLEYDLLKSYYQEHPDNAYFISVEWIAGYSDNFHIQNENEVSNGFNLGGWTTFLPVYNQELELWGIEDVDTALIENENVYLILSAPSSKITAHYEEKYEDVQWTETDTAPVYGMEVPVFKISGGERR